MYLTRVGGALITLPQKMGALDKLPRDTFWHKCPSFTCKAWLVVIRGDYTDHG